MLGHWRKHEEYQRFVIKQLGHYAEFEPELLLEYAVQIEKLWICNLDQLKCILGSCYSSTGRRAEHQPEMFRAFILFTDLKIPISQWAGKLRDNSILRVICGFPKGETPSTASFYDFMARIAGPCVAPRVKKFIRRPNKKIGKNKKMPPKHPGVTAKIASRIAAGRRFRDSAATRLNAIFSVAVLRSQEIGLLRPGLAVSGDGTCVKTGASSHGKKVCGCKDRGIYDCKCPRKFSDPSASWGWDSHNECYFYGYTGYFLSTYDSVHKLDLPLYLRVVDARRHDSVSALVALSEFRDLYPSLEASAFISDSASDNYATYELLERWGMAAVIALGKSNDGKRKYPGPASYDDKGRPICPAGHPMVYDSFYSKDRCRVKWRCPRARGLVAESAECASCSPSPYGRVVYTKPEWDPRIFCRIPRGTPQWRKLMKERTACERVNNRVLHDYGVELGKYRGKNRIAFFVMVAAFNVHLDAQLKVMRMEGAPGLFSLAA